MTCGIIYKISNSVNDKVYIGQTRRPLAKRWKQHKQRAVYGNQHLYLAMRKYGIECFSIEKIDEATSKEELDVKEEYWIKFFNSIKNGYNELPGGTANPMDNQDVKKKHDEKMSTQNTRLKISNTLKQYRKNHPWSDKYKLAASKQQCGKILFIKDSHRSYVFKNDADKKRKLLADGWHEATRAELAVLCATRSCACYCKTENGDVYFFNSYLEAGKWWHKTLQPFGAVYSSATYQRKIKASIMGKPISYGRGKSRIIITNIKWYSDCSNKS